VNFSVAALLSPDDRAGRLAHRQQNRCESRSLVRFGPIFSPNEANSPTHSPFRLRCAHRICTRGLTQLSVADTERLRIEQGKALAAGREMRAWHFEEFKEPMQDWPREVKGAFVELRCEDNKFSEAALIVVRDDFRLRSYPGNHSPSKIARWRKNWRPSAPRK